MRHVDFGWKVGRFWRIVFNARHAVVGQWCFNLSCVEQR